MSAVSDQFLDVGFDGADAGDEPVESSSEQTHETESTAKADDTKTNESAETKGDTSTEAAPPAADADEDDFQADNQRRVPLSVAKSERKKRQETERQLAEMRGELNALRNQARPQSQPTNEKTAEQQREAQDQQFWNGSPSEFVQREIQKAVDDNRYAASWDDAVEKHGQEKANQYADAFAKAVAAERKEFNGFSPLAAKMQNHRRPSLFATETGRTLLETKDIGSVDDLRKKIEAEVRAKVEEEMKRSGSLAMAKNIPQSNVTAKGSSATAEVSQDEIDEPEDMSEILPKGKRR
jgi:hypothetical protein